MSGELMVMMAKLMPEDKLIDMIHEAAGKCKVMSDGPEKKEMKMQLASYCALYGAKVSLEGKDTVEVLQELQRAEKTKDLLDPDKHQS